MLENLICISEFGTKLVAGLSGLVFAIIILVCVVVAKSKKNEQQYPDSQAKKMNADASDTGDKKGKKKNKKASKDDSVADNNVADNADNQSSAAPDNTDASSTQSDNQAK